MSLQHAAVDLAPYGLGAVTASIAWAIARVRRARYIAMAPAMKELAKADPQAFVSAFGPRSLSEFLYRRGTIGSQSSDSAHCCSDRERSPSGVGLSTASPSPRRGSGARSVSGRTAAGSPP
jgi:hypothetical protein